MIIVCNLLPRITYLFPRAKPLLYDKFLKDYDMNELAQVDTT